MTHYVGPKWLQLRNSTPGFARRRVDLPEASLPIVAVDPGGTTGWSLIVLRSKAFELPTQDAILSSGKINWWHGQIDCSDIDYGTYQLKKILDKWPSAIVVMESFSIRQMAVDLSPVKIAAIVQHHLWNQGRIMLWQNPAQAKTTATDDRLKLWNCYTSEGGLNHARDADRHALLFIRRAMGVRGLAVRKKAWPHIFGRLENGS